MEASYFCSSCQRMASRVCTHPSCDSAPFVCEGNCQKQHQHSEPKFGKISQILALALNLRTQNVFYPVNLLKQRISNIHQSLDNLLKKYQNQLSSVGNKPSKQIQRIVNHLLENTPNSVLKGKDLSRLIEIGVQEDPLIFEIKKSVSKIFENPIKIIEELELSKVSAINLETSRGYFKIALGLSEKGQHNQALDHYIDAYKHNFSDAEILFETARCYLSLGDQERGEEFYVRCLQKDKKGLFVSKVYNALGELELKREKLIKAIDYFRKAHGVQSDPQREALYLFNRARAYIANGDYELALEDLNNAIEKHPTQQYTNKLHEVQSLFDQPVSCEQTSETRDENDENNPPPSSPK